MQTSIRLVVCGKIARLGLAVGMVFLAGCVGVPVNFYDAGSRRNIASKTTRALQPGVTTKQDVFLTLGEPDYVSEDARKIGYSWTKVKALWITTGYYGNNFDFEIKRTHVLEATFDDCNRLLQTRITDDWKNQ
jgi:outer membrane protein assembly factor BamE (lipoprotein component of BamABCDE complex)